MGLFIMKWNWQLEDWPNFTWDSDKKEYYQQLGLASKTLDLTDWLIWFANIALEAQQRTHLYIDFIIKRDFSLPSSRPSLRATITASRAATAGGFFPAFASHFFPSCNTAKSIF